MSDKLKMLGHPFSVTVDGAQITDDYLDRLELESARRALKVLRDSLGLQKIYELLRPMIDESNRKAVEAVTLHPERMKPIASDFEVTGIDLDSYLDFLFRKLGDPDFLYYMSPEHFINHNLLEAVGPYRPGDRLVVEPWGEYWLAVSMNIKQDTTDLDFDTFGEDDPSYPRRWGGVGCASGGPVIISIYYQFQPTDKGFKMKSRGALPGNIVLDNPVVKESFEHHYLLEFARAFQAARREFEQEALAQSKA